MPADQQFGDFRGSNSGRLQTGFHIRNNDRNWSFNQDGFSGPSGHTGVSPEATVEHSPGWFQTDQRDDQPGSEIDGYGRTYGDLNGMYEDDLN